MFSPRRPLKLIVTAAVLICFYIFVFPEAPRPSAVLQPGQHPVPQELIRTVTVTATVQAKPKSTSVTRLGKHKYRPDGLLELNPNGPHPIYELVERAERSWADKQARASKTFADAVKEYKRRYSRNPPKGFDIWWQYITKHKVQLPDEYDQIFQDFEPFWSMSPKDLALLQEETETKRDSFTIGRNSTTGAIEVLTWAFQDGKYDQLIVGSRGIINLLKEIPEDLPPFRMAFSPHDGPNRLSSYQVKHARIEAAAERRYLRKSDLPSTQPHRGWLSACAPDSPARQATELINLEKPPLSTRATKTFIHDHALTMDPCLHPSHFYLHGQFISHNEGPGPQPEMMPEFGTCSTTLHHNIRYPTPYGWVEDIPRHDDPPFEEKPDERLLWRGSITGMYHSPNDRWRKSHRDRLVWDTNDLSGEILVVPPNRTRLDPVGPLTKLRKTHINPAVMDIAFAGEPHQCSSGVCEIMKEEYTWKMRQSLAEAGSYKYVFDIDGNGWSGRFKRLITSNSLILKSTIYPEWFSDRVQPWLHYIPVQIDLSDLHDVILFFRGDGNGDGAHDELAKKLAMAGREWSKTYWRREDLVAYFWRQVLEWARLQSDNRDAMSYGGKVYGS